MTYPLNIHPVDELVAIRNQIKALQTREDVIRAELLAGNDETRNGVDYRAFVQVTTRETLDKAALMEALGRDNLEPFLKKTEVRTLKTAKKDA